MRSWIHLALVLLGLAIPARADRFVSGQAASSVLGQADLDSNGLLVTVTKRISSPGGVAVDPTTGKVFVSTSSRILRFSSAAALATGSFPEAVIGQVNFSTTTPDQGGAAGANTLDTPGQITIDRNGTLWVADTRNNRVLCFIAASFLGNNPTADFVFGQPNVTTTTAGTTIAKMNRPGGIAIGPDDSLWVADTDNNRVLRYANISTKATAAAADSVLGQSVFTTDNSGTSASAMYVPVAVAVDADGRLWVADSNNHRVLRFDNAASLADGAPASGVLGQDDFTSLSPGTTASTMQEPRGLFIGPDRTLYVGDYLNGRLLGFLNAAAKADGAAADFVLGKPDFTSTQAGPSPTRMTGVGNPALSPSGHLFVCDEDDHRVLRFEPVKSPSVTLKTKSGRTSASSFSVKGTASGQVTKVTWRVGNSGAFKNAKGAASWSFKAKLKRGKNVITVIAEGPGGTSAAKKLTITRT